jgi:hypothetical protein
MGLPMCWSSSMDVRLAVNRACHSNTHVRLMFSSVNACLIIARVSIALFLRFAQNLMHTRCSFVDQSQNCTRPDIRLKIKGRTNQHVHPAAWNFVHWLPRYASTTIYRCIALLQLLYRWQHQSWKLWMPPRIYRQLLSSPNLFNDLKKQKINCGTVRPNRKGMPQNLLPRNKWLKLDDTHSRTRNNTMAMVRR